MAEILLSLTIIGVVAAITLPSLTGNINERTWNTQRKALYARMSQALALMPALNGYGTLDDTDSHNVTETFITAGLSKVLKINNVCAYDQLGDCGIPDKVVPMVGQPINSFRSDYNTLVKLQSMFNGTYNHASGGGYSYSQTDTKAAAFETANGESVMVYYNPRCVGNLNEKYPYYMQPKVCVNFIYDLNGLKGPNTVGKDIGFMTALYPSDTILAAPNPLNANAMNNEVYSEAIKYCNKYNENSRLANIEELVAAFTNQKLIWASNRPSTLLSSPRASYDPSSYIYMRLYSGQLNKWPVETTEPDRSLCVSR